MNYLKPGIRIAFFSVLALVLLSGRFPFSSSFVTSPPTKPALLMTASADDDEYEGNDDEHETSSSGSTASSSTKPKTKTIQVIKEVIEYKPVTKTIVVTEAAYAKDTDGDGLVDAIDPSPLVPQSEYFTDTDGDGIPNALDKHHDEDDFAYYEFETDENNNGILDSYEQ